MCVQKRIEIIRKIRMDLDNETVSTIKSDTFKFDEKTSSFVAVTTTVLNMCDKTYDSSYSCINKAGGVCYDNHSQITMISILQSNTNHSNENLSIKPIGTLCFKVASKMFT